jgi:hypothetical protein
VALGVGVIDVEAARERDTDLVSVELALRDDVSDGDADTAPHAALAHANVCASSVVSGRLASTSDDAPRSSSVCVAARS